MNRTPTLYFPLIISLFFSMLLGSCKKKVEATEVRETFVLSDTMLKSTTTAIANPQTVKNELNFYGKITADNNKLIKVFPLVGGNVVKVNVELGDYVKKDQILATVRSTDIADFDKQLIDANNELLVATNN
jgi:membrane fusion protein, heavy metal efflux system